MQSDYIKDDWKKKMCEAAAQLQRMREENARKRAEQTPPISRDDLIRDADPVRGY